MRSRLPSRRRAKWPSAPSPSSEVQWTRQRYRLYTVLLSPIPWSSCLLALGVFFCSSAACNVRIVCIIRGLIIRLTQINWRSNKNVEKPRSWNRAQRLCTQRNPCRVHTNDSGGPREAYSLCVCANPGVTRSPILTIMGDHEKHLIFVFVPTLGWPESPIVLIAGDREKHILLVVVPISMRCVVCGPGSHTHSPCAAVFFCGVNPSSPPQIPCPPAARTVSVRSIANALHAVRRAHGGGAEPPISISPPKFEKLYN